MIALPGASRRNVMTDEPTGPDSSGEPGEVAAQALVALRQLTIRLSFDRDDPASVEAAIREFDARIDAVVAPFRGHAFIEEVARQIKSECRDSLLPHIAGREADNPGRTLHWHDQFNDDLSITAMKRDMDLIRELMLKLKEYPRDLQDVFSITGPRLK
jgi:hypothetical protein